jgi:DNA-directed RNA polymerase delta subunit
MLQVSIMALYRHQRENAAMIESLLDACQFVLENQGEAQSSYWLASQIVEMKLWRASEADVRDALNKDIRQRGEESRFLQIAEDEFALRSWTAGSVRKD